MPEMLIGGEWRGATAHEELEVRNPATEEVVDTVPAGAPEDVELAVATSGSPPGVTLDLRSPSYSLLMVRSSDRSFRA